MFEEMKTYTRFLFYVYIYIYMLYMCVCLYNGNMIRDLVKKIRDTKGIFHAKLGLIKDRNGMDLTEAEDIKK